MSDSLSSFIASGIEFIVGGLMLLGATAFLLLAAGWELPEFLSDVEWGSQDASLVVLAIALAAAYAAGVIGEGISRMMLEWDLDRLTVRNKDFEPPPPKPSALTQPAAATVSDTQQQAQPAAAPISQARPSSSAGRWRDRWARFTLGSDHTPEQLAERKKERERQRSAAAMHPGLVVDIESQLKRLRIERVSFLSTLLVGVGFLWAHEWLELLVTVGFAGVLFSLVHERFRRYCGAIIRAYDRVETIERGAGVV